MNENQIPSNHEQSFNVSISDTNNAQQNQRPPFNGVDNDVSTHCSEPEPNTAQQFSSSGIWILTDWKTSPGFSVLGFLGYTIFWFILVIAIAIAIQMSLGSASSAYPANYTGATAGAIASLIVGVLTILYAILGYSSYFTEKPLLKNSKAISFFNFFFGNIIFGALWNYNLTNSRKNQRTIKGVSYIICIILSVLSMLSVGFQLATFDIPYLNYLQNHQQEISNNSTTNSMQGKTLAFPDGLGNDLTFEVPKGWEPINSSSSMPENVVCILTPDDNQEEAFIYCMITDMYSDAPEDFKNNYSASEINNSFFNENYILENGKGYITDIRNQSVEKVNINGYEYWFTCVSGTTDDPQLSKTHGDSAPITEIDYCRYNNGCAYLFLLTSFTTEEKSGDFQKGLDELMKTVNYK